MAIGKQTSLELSGNRYSLIEGILHTFCYYAKTATMKRKRGTSKSNTLYMQFLCIANFCEILTLFRLDYFGKIWGGGGGKK